MKLANCRLWWMTCSVLLTTPHLPALDTNAVLHGWLEAQAGLRTWQADFKQTRTLRTLKHPLVSTGHVWFAFPEQFRWELGEPAQTIAVRDDQQMRVIYPRLKRVERYPMKGPEAGVLGEALALLDAGFPRDRASFDERFRVTGITQTNAAWQLELEPANAGTRRVIPAIQLTLSTNDYSLQANEILLPDGSRMRNDFTNATVNTELEAGVFKPELGKEYQVVEPTKK